MKRTGLFLVGIIVLVLGYDLAAVLMDGVTVSQVVPYWASQSPAVPFIAGFLMGHFFWSRWTKEPALRRRNNEEPSRRN